MPRPPLNALTFFEIVVRGRQAAGGSGTAPSANVFRYRRTGNINNVNYGALNTIFQTTVLVPLLAAANIRYSPNTVSIRCLDDAVDPYQDFPAAGVGAIGTDSEPSDTAVYVYQKVGIRVRGGKGGKHFSGTSEVDTTVDVLTGAGLVRWQAVRDACKAIMVDATPNTWVPTIVSAAPFSQLKFNPTTIVFADVVDALLDLNIGTMRRRRTKTVR